MKRHHVIWLVLVAAAGALAFWIMRSTYWDEITLPVSLKGEAARNPMYAAELLAKKLDATTSRDSLFASPAADAVIFLRDWSWDLGQTRRKDLERWVESGGRLVVDGSVHFQGDAFEKWTGIEFYEPKLSDDEIKRREREEKDDEDRDCDVWDQRGSPPIKGDRAERTYIICDQYSPERLRSTHRVTWSVRDRDGNLALRVPVGKGSVTVVNEPLFVRRRLMSGDHAELFVAATQLHLGDRILFMSEARHPSLVALTWRYGAPVVMLCALALLLALWRNGARFGPLLPASQPLRRSLVEQIRGTGEFTLRHGGGALHEATVRALTTAARRRIPGFATMGAADQAAAMAQAAAISTEELLQALHPAQAQRSRQILSTVALLEAVRRRILLTYAGKNDGKRQR